jgi:hypothetical protein
VRRRRYAAIEPKLVWMFGSPRSGSTWLRLLLTDGAQVTAVSEPLIGMHLGAIASAAVPMWPPAGGMRFPEIRQDEQYFFSLEHRGRWQPQLRQLILSRLAPYAPRRARRCVIQEPNGSEGADVLMAALPKSHLLFLLRDGRDVVDSVLDGLHRGTWIDQAFGVGRELDDRARREVVEHEASRWVLRTRVTLKAWNEHDPRRRHLVRYEDLLADTSKEVGAILRWLNVSAPYVDRVARHAFEAIPPEHRGRGRFHRSASPGAWRENLTADEQEICRRVMGDMLAETGYS